MKVLLIIVLTSLICLFACSCLSAPVIAHGLEFKSLAHESTRMVDTHRELSVPVWSITYPEPIRLSDTSIYKACREKPILIGISKTVENKFISYCEVYSRIGPMMDIERANSCILYGVLTLGLSEFIMVPHAIKERFRLRDDRFCVTFWYDKNRRFVAYTYGDVRFLAMQDDIEKYVIKKLVYPF
ncbi:hypothetical protein JYT61_00565 [bacterium AH-315-E10]|nr:hypothetical protein [bacterium AH-315-E10]